VTGTHCRIVIDAVALIDFLDSNPSVLRLISDHLGRLAAVYEVVCEVDGLDSATCGELGVEVVDANLCQGAIADDRPSGLSRADHLCLLVAKENGWTCLTNDRRLRRECARHGVPVMWTLEALVKLVRKGAVSPPEALSTGTGIHEVNAAYMTDEVLAEFRRLIGHDD
jgi:rRNA-processing protein FCF1